LAFAGLWERFRWPDETVTRSFAIPTMTPNAEMAELHDRMPVILEQQDWPVWLGEAEGEYAALLRPAADGRWIGASAHRATTGRNCWRPLRRRPP
jgi:putative SOS response-associated peptidase YedK